MGTRCATYFSSTTGMPPNGEAAMNKIVEANVFRHWDGYPSSAGTDILKFLELDKEATEGSRVGDVSMLAARYVAFLAHNFNAGFRTRYDYLTKSETVATGLVNPCDFLSVRIDKSKIGMAGDVEFEYWIDNEGEVFVRTACYGWGDNKASHGKWQTLTEALVEDAAHA